MMIKYGRTIINISNLNGKTIKPLSRISSTKRLRAGCCQTRLFNTVSQNQDDLSKHLDDYKASLISNEKLPEDKDKDFSGAKDLSLNQDIVTTGSILDDPALKIGTLEQANDTNTSHTTPKQTDSDETSEASEAAAIEEEETTAIIPIIDTYESYLKLLKSGFTSEQSDLIISIILETLNDDLKKLRKKYVPLTDLENENYLFESAQSELRVDISRSREVHINDIQNLIHILEREFNSNSDELNELFLTNKNDSQVAVSDQTSENTLLHKSLRNQIQELDNKISTELTSGIRTDIEGLRWHTTRSGLIAVLVAVFSILSGYSLSRRQQKSSSEFVPLSIHEPSDLEEDDYHSDIDRDKIN